LHYPRISGGIGPRNALEMRNAHFRARFTREQCAICAGFASDARAT